MDGHYSNSYQTSQSEGSSAIGTPTAHRNISASEEMTKQRAADFLKREVNKLREEVNKLKEDNTYLRQLLFSQQQQQAQEQDKVLVTHCLLRNLHRSSEERL